MDWGYVGCRIQNKWQDIKMYTRHIYRRIRYHWFTLKILVEVPNLKMYQYTDIDAVFTEVNFHLFRNFVNRERGGIKGVEKDIAWLTKLVTEGPKDFYDESKSREWYEGEKECLQRQLDSDLQVKEIYTYVQNRKTAEDYWDLELNEQDKLDEEDTKMLMQIMSLRRYLWT
jgi:hypothetical protein